MAMKFSGLFGDGPGDDLGRTGAAKPAEGDGPPEGIFEAASSALIKGYGE